MASSTTTVNPDLLAMLACPACDDRPPLAMADGASALVCSSCKREYPIASHGYPDLTVETEAEAKESE